MTVRRAQNDDWLAIWPFWHEIVAVGETYAFDPATPEDEGRRLWMLPPPAEVFVLEDDAGAVRGTAVLKPNQLGPGSHVANASFMVDPTASGRGYGRQLAEAVLDRAREAGYQAMQFNAVVATNTAAIELWHSLGFTVVGPIPGAFRHPREGLVDLLVMHRWL